MEGRREGGGKGGGGKGGGGKEGRECKTINSTFFLVGLEVKRTIPRQNLSAAENKSKIDVKTTFAKKCRDVSCQIPNIKVADVSALLPTRLSVDSLDVESSSVCTVRQLSQNGDLLLTLLKQKGKNTRLFYE